MTDKFPYYNFQSAHLVNLPLPTSTHQTLILRRMNNYELFPKDGGSWFVRMRQKKFKPLIMKSSPETGIPLTPSISRAPAAAVFPSLTRSHLGTDNLINEQFKELQALQLNSYESNNKTETTSFTQHNTSFRQRLQYRFGINSEHQNAVQYTSSSLHSMRFTPSHSNVRVSTTRSSAEGNDKELQSTCSNMHMFKINQYTPPYNLVQQQDTISRESDNEIFYSESEEGWPEEETSCVPDSRASTPDSEDSYCSELGRLVTASPESIGSEPNCDICWLDLESGASARCSGHDLETKPNHLAWPYTETNFQDPLQGKWLQWELAPIGSEKGLGYNWDPEPWKSAAVRSGWELGPVGSERGQDSDSDQGIWFETRSQLTLNKIQF